MKIINWSFFIVLGYTRLKEMCWEDAPYKNKQHSKWSRLFMPLNNIARSKSEGHNLSCLADDTNIDKRGSSPMIDDIVTCQRPWSSSPFIIVAHRRDSRVYMISLDRAESVSMFGDRQWVRPLVREFPSGLEINRPQPTALCSSGKSWPWMGYVDDNEFWAGGIRHCWSEAMACGQCIRTKAKTLYAASKGPLTSVLPLGNGGVMSTSNHELTLL